VQAATRLTIGQLFTKVHIRALPMKEGEESITVVVDVAPVIRKHCILPHARNVIRGTRMEAVEDTIDPKEK
jgi:hypothetical protein